MDGSGGNFIFLGGGAFTVDFIVLLVMVLIWVGVLYVGW